MDFNLNLDRQRLTSPCSEINEEFMLRNSAKMEKNCHAAKVERLNHTLTGKIARQFLN